MKNKRLIIGFVFLLSEALFLSSCAMFRQSTKSSLDNFDLEQVTRQYRPQIVDKAARMTDYGVVNSHVIGAVMRPFSYLFRAAVLSKDIAYDSAKKYTGVFQFKAVNVNPLYEGEGMSLDDFEAYLTQLTGHGAGKGSMHFLIGGDKFFPRLIEAIEHAEETIDIRLFIFDNDDYAVEIAELLKKKSREGVRVRVLLDATGQLMGEGKAPEDLPEGFSLPYSMKRYLKKNSNIHVRIRPNAFFKADHTKTITIDNRICFTGGMNIGREYRYHWHDMMMELKGPILGEIIYEFKLAWAHAGFWGDFGYALARILRTKPVIEGKGDPMRLLYTRVNNPELYRAQLEAVRRSKQYVWINNAYFSDNEILYELIRARQRGVDVRIILPDKGNHEIMNQSNVVTANILFRNGIKVYFFPGMSHIKAAIYDGWLCTGSANFDVLSLRDNLEMNIGTSVPESVEWIKTHLFERDFNRSRLMDGPLDSGLSNIIAEILAEQL